MHQQQVTKPTHKGQQQFIKHNSKQENATNHTMTTNRQRHRKITEQHNINFNQKMGTWRGQASSLIGQRTVRLFNCCHILLLCTDLKTSVLPVVQPFQLSDNIWMQGIQKW